MNWIGYVLGQHFNTSGDFSNLSTIEQHLSTFCTMMAFDTDRWRQHVQLTLQGEHITKVMASLTYLQVYSTPIRWKQWWSGLLLWCHQQRAWMRSRGGSLNWLRKWSMHAEHIVVKLERCRSRETRVVQVYDLYMLIINEYDHNMPPIVFSVTPLQWKELKKLCHKGQS